MKNKILKNKLNQLYIRYFDLLEKLQSIENDHFFDFEIMEYESLLSSNDKNYLLSKLDNSASQNILEFNFKNDYSYLFNLLNSERKYMKDEVFYSNFMYLLEYFEVCHSILIIYKLLITS